MMHLSLNHQIKLYRFLKCSYYFYCKYSKKPKIEREKNKDDGWNMEQWLIILERCGAIWRNMVDGNLDGGEIIDRVQKKARRGKGD